MIFHHIQEGHDQLGVVDGNNFIHIFLNVWEQKIARPLNGCSVGNGIDAWESHYFSSL